MASGQGPPVPIRSRELLIAGGGGKSSDYLPAAGLGAIHSVAGLGSTNTEGTPQGEQFVAYCSRLFSEWPASYSSMTRVDTLRN